jgi:hypothetical protein
MTEPLPGGDERAQRRRAARKARAVEAEDRGEEGTADTAPEYEFNAAEEALIRSLASKMRFVGMVGMAGGLMASAFALVNMSKAASAPAGLGGMVLLVFGLGLLVSVVSFLSALWTFRAAVSFQTVAETTHNDVHHLMGALKQLDKVYVVQCISAAVTLFFFLFGILGSLLGR